MGFACLEVRADYVFNPPPGAGCLGVANFPKLSSASVYIRRSGKGRPPLQFVSVAS